MGAAITGPMIPYGKMGLNMAASGHGFHLHLCTSLLGAMQLGAQARAGSPHNSRA